MNDEPPLPIPPPPAADEGSAAFWGYADLLLVAGLALPCMLLVGPTLAGIIFWMLRVHHPGKVALAVPAMLLGYAFLFSVIMVIFRVQYDRPFWRSLGWTQTSLPFLCWVVCGLGTSITVGLVSVLTHMPPSSGPLIELMKDRSTLVALALFGTLAAPLFEELAFRGFLQPLLVRSLGAVAGIGLAAALFGALHFSEYGNSWRSALIVGISGVSFGCIRHFSGSTRAAVIAHAAFNALPFFYVLIQGKGTAS